MRHLIVCLALCVAAEAAHAASADGSFAVDGPGTQTCERFTAAMDAEEETALVAYAAWTEGFVTGVNVFREETYDITPWQTTPLLMAKMQAFCAQNPEMPFVNALGRLIASLMPQRLTEAAELVQTRADGRAVVLPVEILGRVRSGIEEATGETVATSEGSFDEDFAGLIRRYQQEQGLPESGLPDQATLNALFP